MSYKEMETMRGKALDVSCSFCGFLTSSIEVDCPRCGTAFAEDEMESDDALLEMR